MTQQSIADPSRPTRQRVKDLYLAKVPVRQIAVVLDISTQRVYQHLERLRADGDLEGKAS